MVYMSGDNNLEDYIVKDLELELAAKGSTANVQITALADRGPGYDKSRGDWQTTKLYHPTLGMQADAASAVADWGERNLGDPDTLADFVEWSKLNYPADHYALFFWGHGWGWHPGWTMEDDTPGSDGLDPDEVKSVKSRLGFIDVVGYDACNMAQIEIMSLWAGKASALVGSQEYVNMDGIEYDTVINQLNATPTMTADQVAAATSASAVVEKTYSSMALDGRWTTLRTAVDQWAIALKAALPSPEGGHRPRIPERQELLAGPDRQGPLRPGQAGQRPGHRQRPEGQGHGRDECRDRGGHPQAVHRQGLQHGRRHHHHRHHPAGREDRRLDLLPLARLRRPDQLGGVRGPARDLGHAT